MNWWLKLTPKSTMPVYHLTYCCFVKEKWNHVQASAPTQHPSHSELADLSTRHGSKLQIEFIVFDIIYCIAGMLIYCVEDTWETTGQFNHFLNENESKRVQFGFETIWCARVCARSLRVGHLFGLRALWQAGCVGGGVDVILSDRNCAAAVEHNVCGAFFLPHHP